MPYYTDPYGNAGNKAAIMAVADQYKNVPGVQSPDVFAQKFYDQSYAAQGSPWTEGSDFGAIRQQIENNYLNQPALLAQRGGQKVDIASDPATAAWLKQTQAQAVSNADATRNSGGGGLFGKGGLGTLAGLALGAWNPLGWGAIGAGMLGGGAAGVLSGGGLEGGLKGAVLGGIGGAIASGVDSMVGYNPTGADAIWSEGATRASSNLAQGALKVGTNFLTGQATGALNSMMSGAPQQTRQQGIGQSGQQQTGGGMAGIGDITLGQVGQGLGGLADYFTSSSQQNKMSGAFNQAQQLMTTHSPEQQAIRAQTMNMIQKPGDFFNDPLYQAAFGQGQQALERSQAAKGMAGSGGAAAELQKYGMGFGSEMYNQRLAQLSGLSGISQDQTQRNLTGANLIEGAGIQAGLQGSGIAGLAGGIGGMGHSSATGTAGGTGGFGGVTLDQMMSGLKGVGTGLQNIYQGGLQNWAGNNPTVNVDTSGAWDSQAANAVWGVPDQTNAWENLMNYSYDAPLDTSVNTWGY